MPAADATLAPPPAADLALIRGAAREAGRIALGYFGKNPEVWMKGGSSPVSEADYAVDRYLRETLVAARPGYGWLSEETRDTPARLGAHRVFVVDPIDGTRAYIDGRSTWCVSIAVVEAGTTIAGVLECPVKHEVYAATRGGGAMLNGAPIAVRPQGRRLSVAGPKPLLQALPRDVAARMDPVAYIPSLAYRIAQIARGAIDASFVKSNAHDWDLAAADLILAEAGGGIVGSSGRAPRYGGATVRHGPLAAGSGDLLAVMARVVAGAAG